MNVGERDQLIRVVRPVTATDDYGAEIEGSTTLIEEAFARIKYGFAQEKREAAQEGASQTATFEVVPTVALEATRLTDRIEFDGSDWDIAEVAKLDRQTLRFTATRSR